MPGAPRGAVQNVVIAPEDGDKKGREFEAVLMAYVTADSLWFGGATDTKTVRPVYAQFAMSHGNAAPFATNLRRGRVAGRKGYFGKVEERFEFLRSAEYRYATQRYDEGVILTVYLPELFRADAGMVEPEGFRAVLLPSKAWIASQDLDADAMVAHVERVHAEVLQLHPKGTAAQWVGAAALLASHLATKSRCPIPGDPRFWLQALVALVGERRALCRETCSYRAFKEEGTEGIGLARGVGVKIPHDALAALLATEVARYFDAIDAASSRR